MHRVFHTDITAASLLLNQPRRVIQEVTRRSFFKGNNHCLSCRTCPAWERCDRKDFFEEDKDHASKY